MGITFPRMSSLHRQEQFSSVNGKTKQQRSLRGGSPERWPDCGTCSAHHIPAFAPCLFGSGSIVCTITGASITRAGKSLVKMSMVLKVIFDRLLGHSAQEKRLFATHLISRTSTDSRNSRK